MPLVLNYFKPKVYIPIFPLVRASADTRQMLLITYPVLRPVGFYSGWNLCSWVYGGLIVSCSSASEDDFQGKTNDVLDIWQNKRRAAQIAALGLTNEEATRQGHMNAEMDMTDTENIFFKYSY
jgi:hypothetical protein